MAVADFPDDPAWKIDPARVSKGRALYAEICAECHLGPVNDPVFDKLFPDQSFWSSEHWDAKEQVLNPVQKSVAGMGTDKAQANVLFMRKVEVPGFLNMQPGASPGKDWGCQICPTYPFSTEMPYSIALMTAVDLVSRKWMDDHNDAEKNQNRRDKCLGEGLLERSCPNPGRTKPRTIVRAR